MKLKALYALTITGLIILLGLPGTSLAMEAEDAPEEVVIDTLANLYEPVTFDHLMHVDLASCEQCHHHTTGSAMERKECSRCHENDGEAETVACSDCHAAQRFAPAYLKELQDPRRYHIDQPGLKGAYHLGCLGCHREQEGPTGCQDCHQMTETGQKLFKTALGLENSKAASAGHDQ